MIEQDQSPSRARQESVNQAPGSRRVLTILRVVLLATNIALLFYFVQNFIAQKDSSAMPCKMTMSQLPVGPASPLTAKNDVNHFGHPLTLPWLQGKSMHISGSSALYPLLNDGAATFNSVNKTNITVLTPTNSTQGLLDVNNGLTQIAMSDIFADDISGLTSAQLNDYIVAVIPFTLIANTDLQSKVHNLTGDQIRKIYAGTVSNWQDVGGPDEHITVINRPDGSGTRISFQKYVLGAGMINVGNENPPATTQALVQQVINSPGAIGYAATSDLATLSTGQQQQILPLCIDGYGATTVNIADGDYQFWNLEHLYTAEPFTDPLSIEQTFFGFVCGGDFQAKDVLTYGFLHPTQLAGDALASHIPAKTPHEMLQKCAI